MLGNAKEDVLQTFIDYTTKVSETTYRSIKRKRFKIFNP